jgi:hypothetical protein
MVHFQTKNPNSGKFWGVFQWKMLVYFMTIGSILQPFGMIYDNLVYFIVVWYIFPVSIFCAKKNLATLHPQYLMSTKYSDIFAEGNEATQLQPLRTAFGCLRNGGGVRLVNHSKY